MTQLPGPFQSDFPQGQQLAAFTCSCRTAYWMLASLGGTQGPEEIATEMVELGLVTPEYGLMDGSGVALSRYLADKSGYPTGSLYPASWDDLLDSGVGNIPCGMGGSGWYHWVGVRDWAEADLSLANSADGYMGVGQVLTERDFDRLGPFALVWIVYTEGDDLSAEERAELEAYRQQQPYFDTALGTPESPGGLVGQALGTIDGACGAAAQEPAANEVTAQLVAVVTGQTAGLRASLGL